jgi:hypothetical protein
MTTTAEQLEQWRGHTVVDADGQDIGKLDDVFYAANGEPVLARVRRGLLGRRRALVPLRGSSVSRDHLRVGYPQAQIDAAGQTEVGEFLDAATAALVGGAYGEALPGADSGYESSARLQARQDAAVAAKRQADSLEDDAHRLGGQAAHERAKAADADASATRAEHDATDAGKQADVARREAEAAAQAARPAQQ